MIDKTVLIIALLVVAIMVLALTGKIQGSDAMLVITAITGYVLRENTAVNRAIHQNGGQVSVPHGTGTVSVKKVEGSDAASAGQVP